MSSLEQVTISAPDFAPALDFYDAVLGAIGLVRLDELVDEEEDDAPVEAAAWGSADGTRMLWLVQGPHPTSGVHLRFAVRSRTDVENFYLAATRCAAQIRSAPRRWPLYRTGEFNAIVTDPSGNLIEVVGPEES